MPKPVALIVACSENRVIARAGRTPWRISEDLAFFKAQTAGQILIMGRLTFAAWPSAPGDGRRILVVTRDTALARDGVRTAPSLAAALTVAETLEGAIYVCGGERLFAEAIALPQTQHLYLTLVHAVVPGDRTFPEWQATFPRIVRQRPGADAHWRYTFLECERSS